MTNAAIFNIKMYDGSLHLLCLPEVILADELVERINACGDRKVREFLYSVPESWIDFEFLDRQFTINTQFGEYRFFVDDPNCSADVLIAVRDRFVEILGWPFCLPSSSDEQMFPTPLKPCPPSSVT